MNFSFIHFGGGTFVLAECWSRFRSFPFKRSLCSSTTKLEIIQLMLVCFITNLPVFHGHNLVWMQYFLVISLTAVLLFGFRHMGSGRGMHYTGGNVLCDICVSMK